jgi:hypothetical protein
MLLPFIIFVLFFLYVIFGMYHLYILCSPPPHDGISHTKIDFEVNWQINKSLMLRRLPLLSLLVSNHLIFYWLGSILSIIFIYLKTSSWEYTILATVLSPVVAFVSLKMMASVVIWHTRKHWRW